MVLQSWIINCLKNVQNIKWSHKLYRENHENLESGINSGREKLGVTHTSQKRVTSQYSWHNQNSTTGRKTWTFEMNLFSCWIHVLKRNICWHQEQGSTAIEIIKRIKRVFTFQDKSSLVHCNNIVGLIKSMGIMLQNGDFIDSYNRSLKVVLLHNENSFFYQSLLGIQYKWKKLATAWIFCCLLLTNRSTNGWSLEILKW